MTTHANLLGWASVKKAMLATTARVKVGILADSQHEPSEPLTDASRALRLVKLAPKPPISMLELAAIHEFGSPAANIPERSFIRATFSTKREELAAAIEGFVGHAIRSVLEHAHGRIQRDAIQQAAKRALGQVGLKAVSMIKATIRDRQTVGPEDQANKPATIKRKKSSLPLVDTAQLINAITHVVIDNEEVK